MSQLLAGFEPIALLALAVAAALVLIIAFRWWGVRSIATRAAARLKGDGGYDYGIAGAHEHQPVLGRIAGNPGDAGHECTAELVPDVSRAGELRGIWVMVDGARVGHIPPGQTGHFHAVIGGHPARCEAVIVAENGALSVRIDTVWPPRLG